MTTQASRAVITSPVVLRYHITKKGGEFIDKLRHASPEGELSELLTSAARDLVFFVGKRNPDVLIPPEHDFLLQSTKYPEDVDIGFLSERCLEQSEGLFEIEMPNEFFEWVKMLWEMCQYKSMDAAIRHVFLFAHYRIRQTREPGFIH